MLASLLALGAAASPVNAQVPEDKALGRVASASSSAVGDAYCASLTCTADRANDGNANTKGRSWRPSRAQSPAQIVTAYGLSEDPPGWPTSFQ